MAVNFQTMLADLPGGSTRTHAAYPPVMTSMTFLGTIEDFSQRTYSRDGGQSSMLGGHAYYIFGETIWHGCDGNTVKRQSNTAAIVMDPARPLISAYLSLRSDGSVKAFVAPNDDETTTNLRLRATGGIVETSTGVGWMYYQKDEEDEEGGVRACGVAATMVSVRAATGEIEAYRGSGELLFGAEEPRVGSLSSIIEGDFIYSWGHLANAILLARVPKRKPWDRAGYSFWNGEGYVEDWRAAEPVLGDMAHGSVMKSGLFGAGKDWVFVGCSRGAADKVIMGAASSLEGPWELTVLCAVGGVGCIYPHQWGYNEAAGEVMVSWRENPTGGVVAARLKLEMGQPTFWKTVAINDCSDAIRQYLAPDGAEVADISRNHAVDITRQGRFVMQGFAAPEGVIPLHLRVEGVDEKSVDRAARLLYWQINLLSADERRHSGHMTGADGTQRRSGALRALRRVFGQE